MDMEILVPNIPMRDKPVIPFKQNLESINAKTLKERWCFMKQRQYRLKKYNETVCQRSTGKTTKLGNKKG